MEVLHQYVDNCPSCGETIRISEDAVPGEKMVCAACGAELTLTFLNDQPDIRLASEIDDDELERYIH